MSRAIREQAAIANGAHVRLAFAQQVTEPSSKYQITAADVISKTVAASQGLATSSNVQVLSNGQPMTPTVPFSNGYGVSNG